MMIDKNDPRLTAYVLGELDEGEADEIRQAIEESSELRKAVEEIEQTSETVGSLLMQEPCPALTDEQRETLTNAEHQAPSPDAAVAKSSSSARPWGRLLAVAACLTVAVGLVWALANPNGVDFKGGSSVLGKVDKQSRSDDELREFTDGSRLGDGSGRTESGDRGGTDIDAALGHEEQKFGGYGGRMAKPDDEEGRDNFANRERRTVLEEQAASAKEAQDIVNGILSTRDSSSELRPQRLGGLEGGPEKSQQQGQQGKPQLNPPGDPASLQNGEDFDVRRPRRRPGNDPANGQFGKGTERDPQFSDSGKGEAAPQPRNENAKTKPAPEGERLAKRGEFDDPFRADSGNKNGRPELGTNSLLEEFEQESGAILKDVENQAGLQAQAIQAEVMEKLRRSGARLDTAPAEARAELELLRKAVDEASELEADVRKKIRRSIEAGIRLANRGEKEAAHDQKGDRGGKDRKRSWRRVKATPNASRLLVGDNDELPLQGMQANVHVDGFRARVVLDCYFYNDRGRQLEGNFKLRLPDDASLYYFAFGDTTYQYRPMVDQVAGAFLSGDVVRAARGLGPKELLEVRRESWGNVKEARVVPREKAAHAYGEVVRRRVDPALVEWAGAGVFSARVFPLQSGKLHRIVVGYDVNLKQLGDDLVYKLQIPEDLPESMVDVSVAATPGARADAQPRVQPFVSGGRAFFQYKDPRSSAIEIRLRQQGPVTLVSGEGDESHFFATRVTPDLAAGEQQKGSGKALLLIDTSLSSNPDKFNIWLRLAEEVLTRNRGSIKQFAVMFFDIETHWWKNRYVVNSEENVNALMFDCSKLSLEGATDVEQALREAVSPRWMNQAKTLGSPDLFLLSDGSATWGEIDYTRLAGIVDEAPIGAVFAYNTGMTGTAIQGLDHLTRESGGAVFSMTGEDEIATAAVAHRQRPWRLLEASIEGGGDLLIAGRPRNLYPNQPLTIVGRGLLASGAELNLHVRRGDETKRLRMPLGQSVESDLAPRLYGQVAVGQLEDLGATIEDVAIAYARHFRITGRTCSLLMLESEADYQRFKIKPEDDAFVVKSSPAAELVVNKLDELAERLGDPKAATTDWLARLTRTPGVQFRMPTALRVAVDRMPAKSFEVIRPRLTAKRHGRGDLPKKYFPALQAEALSYDLINEEATRRADGDPARALKALSSLVETNPGDTVLARDVAFSALEWKLPGQAYPLLRRIVRSRPFEPQAYQAVARCLTELGRADLAMIYYEVAVTAHWHNRYKDVHRIAGVEYLDLLRKINLGELPCEAVDYAKARFASLKKELDVDRADLLITMMWSTDRTDVDLHVIEPSGDECFYKNPRTRSGGRITDDVTEGFGPEMYLLRKAKSGRYQVLANYFGTDANRTKARTKVYVAVYENFGDKNQTVTRKTVLLSNSKEKRVLTDVKLKK